MNGILPSGTVHFCLIALIYPRRAK